MTVPASHGAGVPAGPIKGKNQFRGVLSSTDPDQLQSVGFSIPETVIEGIYVAFKMGEDKQKVIFLDGLTDGFLATEYLEPLVISLDNRDGPLCKGSSLLHTWDRTRPACNKYYYLCACLRDDDMFSSDLSDDKLKTRLGHLSNKPCQVIFSMADKYVPEYVDKKALVEKLCRALGGAEKVEIERRNHSLSNRIPDAVQAVIDFIIREVPKGWDDPWS